MNLYERLGHKQEQLEEVTEAYAKTIGLLQRLKKGELSLEQVVVDPTGTWQVFAKAPPSAPSQEPTQPTTNPKGV